MPRSTVDDAEDFTGERAEDPNPSAFLESMLFLAELVADGHEELRADKKRQHARVDQELDDVLLPTGHLRHDEAALQMLERQLDRPALAIDHADIRSRDLVDGKIGDVAMVFSLLFIANADKAEPPTSSRMYSGVHPSAEGGLDLKIEHR